MGLTSRFLLLEKERVLASFLWMFLLAMSANEKTLAVEGAGVAADWGVPAVVFTLCFGGGGGGRLSKTGSTPARVGR